MSWPRDKPLNLPQAGWLLSTATPEQYDSVLEDKLRWFDAVTLHNALSRGQTTRASVWARWQSEPEIYREDMARRLRALKQTRPAESKKGAKNGL
jgi:hypothetical protein